MEWSPSWFVNLAHAHIVNWSNFGIELSYWTVPSFSSAYFDTEHWSLIVCNEILKIVSAQKYRYDDYECHFLTILIEKSEKIPRFGGHSKWFHQILSYHVLPQIFSDTESLSEHKLEIIFLFDIFH